VKHIIGSKTPGRSAEVKTLVVDPESAGQRLDNYLLRLLKGVPKTHIYRIIRSGEVRVNKGRSSADKRIEAGDKVRVPPLRLPARVNEKAEAMGRVSVPEARAREFSVLFEDETFLAIDKPAGVAVHGGSGVSLGVIEQLRMARPQASFLELVHRIDRETSGVLLIAKKRSALKNLQDQFRERETGKTYLALVSGLWPVKLKVLDKPLNKYLLDDGERRVRVLARGDPEGMKSVTLVKVRERIEAGPGDETNAYSLLEVTIKTGRTHQIRVHLAAEGRPIVGDDKYGNFELNRVVHKQGLKRMFLHAWRLQFKHPATGEKLELQSQLPADLTQLLKKITPSHVPA